MIRGRVRYGLAAGTERCSDHPEPVVFAAPPAGLDLLVHVRVVWLLDVRGRATVHCGVLLWCVGRLGRRRRRLGSGGAARVCWPVCVPRDLHRADGRNVRAFRKSLKKAIRPVSKLTERMITNLLSSSTTPEGDQDVTALDRLDRLDLARSLRIHDYSSISAPYMHREATCTHLVPVSDRLERLGGRTLHEQLLRTQIELHASRRTATHRTTEEGTSPGTAAVRSVRGAGVCRRLRGLGNA